MLNSKIKTTMMLMTLIFTITSITSTHLKLAYPARHFAYTDDLPTEDPGHENDHCRLELFDDDYEWRTQNRFASCQLEKHWQWTKESKKYYTYSTCSNLITMRYDMKDDLKQVKSIDCNCTLDWFNYPKKDKYFNLGIGETKFTRGIPVKQIYMHCSKGKKNSEDIKHEERDKIFYR